MTTKDLTQYVGQTLLWRHSSFRKFLVEVTVKDARQMYGRTDLLITPVSGSGEQWVSAESCKAKVEG